ncbi:hypothetical protein [Mycobacteroides abscessus]|uniref:hypothetical protein n=1 Tax=Mycobacteroides abscessus TaxID=36809 RepID=UPI0010420601|nr:hypothetical protein [Mycobacteroides abscessus]
MPAPAIVAAVGPALPAPAFGSELRGTLACVVAGLQGAHGLTLIAEANLATRGAFLQVGASVLHSGTSLLSHGNS